MHVTLVSLVSEVAKSAVVVREEIMFGEVVDKVDVELGLSSTVVGVGSTSTAGSFCIGSVTRTLSKSFVVVSGVVVL